MKKIILIIIFITLSIHAKVIIISNKESIFGIKETIKLNIKRDNNFIMAKIIRGYIRIETNEYFTKRYIHSLQLCIGKYIKEEWYTEVCSPLYKLNKHITSNDIIQLEKWFFISIKS